MAKPIPQKSLTQPMAPKVTKAQTITPTSAKTKMGMRAAGRSKMKGSPQVRANQRKPNG
jgi:hypothetical protein